ncbi:hypothetical protein [Nocardia sp. NPDC050710]|uniref:hypothetical protein n=1 Tax=Nocardia sp. NPDC050710 TaxID=3157220 RepID=UPI0033EF08D6
MRDSGDLRHRVDEIRSIASEHGSPVRIACAGTLVSLAPELVKACAADPRIPSVRVLCPDPEASAFLRWIDAVGGESWNAWIARRRILRTVAGIRAQVPDYEHRISVGLHRLEILADFVMIGTDAALVLAPDADPAATTVEFSKSAFLTFEEHRPVLGAFAGLWRVIETHGDTAWLTSPVESDRLPRWPSLYKGNAVLEAGRDGHEDAAAVASGSKVFSKWCAGDGENAAELVWVTAAPDIRTRTHHFRPVGGANARYSGTAALVSHLAPVSMEAAAGVSLFELAYTLNYLGQNDGMAPAASRILGEIVDDSVKSLSEFRAVADSVSADLSRTRYPYADQGDVALRGLTGGPVSGSDISNAVDDYRELGVLLESSCTVSFRDAHLKNRIWVTDESAAELGHRLVRLETGALRSEIMRCVVDIDFESAGRYVTPWDDVAHILFFEMSGLGPLAPDADGMRAYETWWGPVEDAEGLLRTVLARSAREACRRWWYARHMPQTYIRRYSLESTDAFLELALWAAARLNGFDRLAKVLAVLRETGGPVSDMPRRSHPHIPAVYPADRTVIAR